MELKFDLDKAMERINRELEALAEELVPVVYEAKKKAGYPEYLLEVDPRLGEEIRFIPENPKYNYYLMLWDLSQYRFWQGVTHWSEVTTGMSDEDKEFYANVMIGQALQAATREEKVRPADMGYHMILEFYDAGYLRPYISDELLYEAVNRGFWEFTRFYLAYPSPSANIPPGELDLLERYYHLLDLERFEEFGANGDIWSPVNWVSEGYLERFRVAQAKLSKEKASYLIRPYFHQVIETVFQEDEDSPAELFQEELREYEAYFETKIIQCLLRYIIKNSLKSAEYILDVYLFMSLLECLVEKLDMTDVQKRAFISGAFPLKEIKENTIFKLIAVDFPTIWLTDNTLNALHDKIVKALDSRSRGEIVQNLDLIYLAARKKWIEEKEASCRIVPALEKYLQSRAIPSADSLLYLMRTLRKDYISDFLYEKTIRKIGLDLEKRGKHDEFAEWQKKHQ